MPRLKKLFKKYERHLLLALVILLLGTFSITGAIKCARGGSRGVDVGGSFLVTPTDRESLSSEEIAELRHRFFDRGRRAVEVPTLRYRYLFQRFAWPPPWISTWLHAMVTLSAERAGYRVGDGQRDEAVREVVGNAQRMEPTEAAIERFLREDYRGSASELRKTVGEVVVTDEFVEPFMEAARYELGYDAAYEQWKTERERVNLRYVALSGEPFTEAVAVEETTRSRIARQEEVLSRAITAAKQIRQLLGAAQSYEKTKQKPPETLAELQSSGVASGSLKQDPWQHDLVYSLKDGKPWPRYPGPDGQIDTADDVTPDVLKAVETHALLREVANALRQWREAAGSWPESLAKLRERPAANTLPPLKRPDVKDAYGQDLVYVPGTAEAPPKLSSAGADGQPGTADDVPAEIGADTLHVPIGPGLTAYLLPDLKDAWDRALRAQLKVPEGWMVEVSSAGPDGEWGTADDLTEGNGRELLEYYSRPAVKTDFVDPIRRRFRAIVLHLPLLPDDVLKAMWNDPTFAAQRPTDEEKLFEQWRFYKDQPFYGSADPKDPEKGYGAELAKKLAPGAPTSLVPDRAIFGAPPEGFAKPDDPLRKEYLDKGWREVLFREHFLANVLGSLLDEARKSHEAAKAWDQKKARGDDVGEKPAEVALKDLFETRIRKHLPAGDVPYAKYYETPKLLTQAEWEALADFDDLNFSTNLSSATGEGDYPPIVIPLHQRMTHVLAQNVEFRGQRQREFAEVREDEAFLKGYQAAKRLDRAQKELEALRRLVETKEAAAQGDAKAKAFDEALVEWSAKGGAGNAVDETGWFIGSAPPTAVKPGEKASPEDRLRLLRRNFVRLAGYETVRAMPSRQDTVEAAPNTFGRNVLRDESAGDDATASAFLIRVIDRRFPPKEELSPARWADIAAERYFGDFITRRNQMSPSVAMREGAVFQVLAHFFDDIDWARSRFELKTKTDLTQASSVPAR